MIKLQNHNAHKKKNVWTPEAQTGTWKNNRQSKNMGEIKKASTTTPTQCYILLQKWGLLKVNVLAYGTETYLL